MSRARQLSHRLLITISVLLALVLLPSESQAANIPSELRPGSRPHFFQFGGGVSHAFAHGRGRLAPDHPRYFRGFGAGIIHAELGFHLNGTPKGPALGFILQNEIGYNDPFDGAPIGFVVAPKFQWDIQPVKGLAVYIAPNVSVGYHGVTCRSCRTFDVAHFADMQFGASIRAVVNDRFIAWLMLPQFQVMIGTDLDFVVRYQAMTGIGIAFP